MQRSFRQIYRPLTCTEVLAYPGAKLSIFVELSIDVLEVRCFVNLMIVLQCEGTGQLRHADAGKFIREQSSQIWLVAALGSALMVNLTGTSSSKCYISLSRSSFITG